jgi:adenylate cyclase
VRSPRLTLRATLLSLVLGLLLATIAALATVNYLSQSRSLADLEARYFALASETAQARLQQLLQPAAPTLDEAVYSAGVLRTLPVMDDEAVADYGLARIRFVEGLTWFYYGDAAAGRFVGARKGPDGTLVVARSAPDRDGGERHEESVAADGTRRAIASAVPAGFDPRVRPWFREAAGRDGIAWTGPYVLFTQQELGVTASRALRDPAGQVVGVFGVDLTIRDLGGLLARFVEGSGGRAYLVDRGGSVIASSAAPGSSGEYPVLTAALTQAASPLGELPLGVPETFGFAYAGERWLAAIQAFPLQGDVQWATAYLVPERALLEAVYQNQRTALGLGLALLLLAVVLAMRLSRGVARPLRALADDLARVGQFELSGHPPPRSAIREVVVLGDAVERMKASLRSFARYVPAEVVRDLLARGEEARLGGELRTLTIYFSDIEGFTTLSEQLAPPRLVENLSDYLQMMTATMREYQGTVNQFYGDGLLVLFNAPTLVPDHAAQACRAALRAQERLAAMRDEWAATDRPRFRTRIGLHTGEVLVGTFGTAERFAYSAIGDAMNLASRLEGLNKVYGTFIMASEELRTAAGAGFEWRRLDLVAVVGRAAATPVYELLGEAGQVAPQTLTARDRYEAALEAYFAGRFEDAAAGFRAAAALQPQDRAAPLMARRAADFEAYNPGPNWHGVHVETHK